MNKISNTINLIKSYFKNNFKKIALLLLFSFSLFNFSYAAYDKDLRLNSSGLSVIELQEFLIKNNYLKAKANGNYGPATQKAVKDFQKKNKISQTGTFGPATRAAVKKISKSIVSGLPSSLTDNSVITKSNVNFSKEIKDILNKNFTTGVWVPYWREASGSAEVLNNLNKIDIISPFSFEMRGDGTFTDPMKLDTGAYADMIKIAKENKKIIVPSILWWATGTGRDELHSVLSEKESRLSLINDIKISVKKYNLDGIDIDFENKLAESRVPFNTFLTELSKEMHDMNKVLICTIEARTPLDSKYANLSSEEYKAKLKEVDYSNDFKTIGKVCDQVRIMAYDQQDDDKQLNSIRQADNTAYKPVADIDWVEKVLTLAMRDIEWKKIIVGVPTYGNKYEITRDVSGKINNYKKIGSMNYFYADAEAKEKNLKQIRDSSGELSYTYVDIDKLKEYYVVYSDAEAIAQKINIARLYKIGGIAIFKVDGNNDKNIWNKI